jgi:DNA-binding beta-propeller fold protein YncE
MWCKNVICDNLSDMVTYKVVNNWPSNFNGALAGVTGIAVDSNGRVYVAGGDNSDIVVFDSSGSYACSWGKDFLKGRHGLRIFNDEVWITDIKLHQVFKCTLTGKVLEAFGRAEIPGANIDQFNKPTDVAVDGNGNIYVTDGYGNSRVICFDSDGGFKFSWGEHGSMPGEFVYPHNIVIDKDNRIYIADRGNRRVQIFDANGNYLSEWTNTGQPYGLCYFNDKEQSIVFVTDGAAEGNQNVFIVNPQGSVLGQFGGKGTEPGLFQTPHSIAIDSQQNIYVAEVVGKRVQKFILTH